MFSMAEQLSESGLYNTVVFVHDYDIAYHV